MTGRPGSAASTSASSRAAVRAQRGHQQFCFRAEVRVQRAAAHVGGHGDVGDPRAVVSAPGEDVRRREQQPLAGFRGGDASDASHDQN